MAAQRDIPWDKLGAHDLAPAKRQAIGLSWRERMRQEHLAVGAFALLSQELAYEGCDSVVLSLVTRAASDEVRHAEVCRRMAIELLGQENVPARFRGLPNVPKHRGVSSRERVFLHLAEMCCINETITGAHFAEVIKRASNDAARIAMESLLEDEIDHGRVGWAYLASAGDASLFASLARALPAMLDRTVGRIVRAPSTPEPSDPEMTALAYLGTDESAALCGATLRDVILPGFEYVGADVGEARAHAERYGWLGRTLAMSS